MDNFSQHIPNIREKSLRINLDPHIYGSFAEIGAGQDVAAHFFKAGGASGTVAKTMSAYDMQFSDAIYGKAGRYVCENRLLKMLEHEYGLLELRLTDRKEDTRFFAFADTVETTNFMKSTPGHGWIGCRFQLHPDAEPNECVIHVVMHEVSTSRQQQAIGMIGVNLLYACFHHYENPDLFLNSLVDHLLPGRVEIDMFRLTGPDFEEVDNRLMSLKLVKNGLTNATMFGSDGQVMQASDALYKKCVLALRGRFRPVTKVNLDMLEKGKQQFINDLQPKEEDKMIVLTELTLNALDAGGDIDEKDFLDRVDILCSLGQTVMISNFQEFYKLAEYLAKLNQDRHIGIILGVHTLRKVFNESYYSDLPGGLLESFGKLFSRHVKLYAYPTLTGDDGAVETCDNFELDEKYQGLLQYLRVNNKVDDIKNADTSIMHITSDRVLEMIQSAEDGWEEMVPEKVSAIVKLNCLFDYPCSLEEKERAQAMEKLGIPEA